MVWWRMYTPAAIALVCTVGVAFAFYNKHFEVPSEGCTHSTRDSSKHITGQSSPKTTSPVADISDHRPYALSGQPLLTNEWLSGQLTHLQRASNGLAGFRKMYVDAVSGANLAYCSSEKTGCTAWRRVMYLLAHPEKAIANYTPPYLTVHRWFYHRDTTVHPALQVVSPIMRRILDGSLLAFVIVRDPLDRFISAFLNKCVSASHLLENNCPVKVVTPRNDTMQLLDEVLRVLLKQTIAQTNTHFRPQSAACGLALFSPWFHVIRFTHMEEDSRRLLLQPGQWPESVRAPLQNALENNVFVETSQRANPSTHLKAVIHLTKLQLTQIMTLYAADYALWNIPVPEDYVYTTYPT